MAAQAAASALSATVAAVCALLQAAKRVPSPDPKVVLSAELKIAFEPSCKPNQRNLQRPDCRMLAVALVAAAVATASVVLRPD